MANQLKMAKIETILTLHAQNWSIRAIARALNVHRDTVARHVRRSKLGQALTGSEGVKLGQALAGSEGVKLGQALTGSEGPEAGGPPACPEASAASAAAASRSRQASLCEPRRAVILEKLELGLTAQRIWQDLAGEHNFPGACHSVRRFIRRLERSQALPFRRMECAPGEEAQVDFGSGAPIVTPEGKRRRPHVFRIVLSHSRKGYSEAVYRQTTEAFLSCLENAFWHFGGVPTRRQEAGKKVVKPRAVTLS